MPYHLNKKGEGKGSGSNIVAGFWCLAGYRISKNIKYPVNPYSYFDYLLQHNAGIEYEETLKIHTPSRISEKKNQFNSGGKPDIRSIPLAYLSCLFLHDAGVEYEQALQFDTPTMFITRH